jgi:hypothetical protein
MQYVYRSCRACHKTVQSVKQTGMPNDTTASQAHAAAAIPAVVDRATWQTQLDDLLVREKAHTREGT